MTNVIEVFNEEQINEKLNKDAFEVANEETDLTEAQLKKLLNPSKLTKGGISK